MLTLIFFRQFFFDVREETDFGVGRSMLDSFDAQLKLILEDLTHVLVMPEVAEERPETKKRFTMTPVLLPCLTFSFISGMSSRRDHPWKRSVTAQYLGSLPRLGARSSCWCKTTIISKKIKNV